MKMTLILLFGLLFLSSCQKSEDIGVISKDKITQIAPNQETFAKEPSKSELSYVFDIDNFKYLDEFPRTISGIKTMYPKEQFVEGIFDNNSREFDGSYWYEFKSTNIKFTFSGDTTETANLMFVTISNPDYQCKTMQIIGIPIEKMEDLSNKRLTVDKTIKISTEQSILIIEAKNGIVDNYTILDELL